MVRLWGNRGIVFSRIWVGCVAVAALVFGLVVAAPGSAQALSPGLHFSADNQSTWQTNGIVWALGASGGKVIAGGTFSEVRPPEGGAGTPQPRSALAIFDAETGQPDSCVLNVTLSGGTATVRSIDTSADGNTVYIAGNFSNVGGVTVGRVAAINVQTCSVLPLRPNTIGSFVYGITVHENTLYIAGAFHSVAGQQRDYFAALNATTGALLPWTANADGIGRGVAVSPDGSKVAIGGDFFSVNGAYSHSLAVVDASTGANVRTYPPGFIPDTSVTKNVESGPDMFYISNEGTGGGVFDGRAAFSWTTLDQVWRDTCLGATQATMYYKGTLYSVNHAHDCSGINGYQDGIRRYFIAQDAQTMAHIGWLPLANDGIGEQIGPRALIAATGKTTGKTFLWVGGEFTRINGGLQQGLSRFGPDDSGAPPTPVAAAEGTSDGTIQVRVRTVVDSDDSDLTYTVLRNNQVVWSGQATSLWWKRPQVTYVDTNVVAGQSYSYRVRVSDGTNTSGLSAAVSATALTPSEDYRALVRSDSPTFDWSGRMATGWVQDTGAASTSTVARAGVPQGGVTTVADSPLAGDAAGSLSFDGSDDYVWDQMNGDGPNTYTIETWIKTTTTSGGKIVGFGSGRPNTGTNAYSASGSYDRHIYMENSGRIRFGVYTGSTETIRSPQALNDGAWHHIVATQSSSGLALYVDGVRVGRSGVTTAQAYSGVWRIGGDNLSGWPNQPSSSFFNGLIDETAIYPTALSQTRVAQHYIAAGGALVTNPAPADAYGAAVHSEDPLLYWRLDESSGSTAKDSSFFGANPGVYGSGVQKGQTGVVADNNAIQTTASTNATVATNVAMPQSTTFSAEVWFKTATTQGGKIYGVENTQTGNGANYDKHLYMRNDGRLVFGTWIGSAAIVESPSAYNDNKWHQAVAVLDSSGRKLYVDGQLVASSVVTGGETGDGYWRLGGGNLGGWPSEPSSQYFAGSIDEFSVYAQSLSAATVASHFALGVADVTPPTVPGGVSATANGDDVTVTWTASTDASGVAGYRVHRGTTADFTPDNDSTLAGQVTGTAFTDQDLTAGTYYYKVIAVDVAGNLSPASAAAQAVVPDLTAPTSPTGLIGVVSGDAVALSWTASADAVGVTGYRVYRGVSADFAVDDDGVTLVGEATDTALEDAGLTPGTYFYRVLAVDAAGNASELSSAVDVTIATPDLTAPTTPTNVAASVTGDSVALTWTASTDGVGVAGYRVYRGASANFAIGDSGVTLIGEPTDTAAPDAGLAPGTYFYRVLARDAAGNTSDLSAAVSATIAEPPAEPVTMNVDVAADGAVLQTAPTTNYGLTNQIWSRGTGSAQQQAFLAFDLPATPTGTTLTSASLRLRTSTDSTAASANDTIVNLMSGAWTEAGLTWNNRPTAVGDQLGTLTGTNATNTAYTLALSSVELKSLAGQRITLRLLTNGDDNLRLWSREATNAGYRPLLSLEFTPVGAPDTTAPSVPAGVATSVVGDSVSVSWQASTDAVGVTGYRVYRGASAGFAVGDAGVSLVGQPTSRSYTDAGVQPGTYFYRVAAIDAAGNVSALSSAAQAIVTAPDTVAPTVPTAVSATASGSAVAVSWTASTDEVGVAGYRVYRGGSADFTVGGSGVSLVGEPTGVSQSDTSLAPGSYFYRVLAFDAAGNVSALSSAAAVTVVQPPAEPSTVTVTASADSMVLQTNPTTNYGSNTQLAARGGSGLAQEALLSFELPAAPAGTALTAATLRVRTSADAAAGTADSFQIDLLSGAWSEAAVTWNNRPTSTIAGLGTLAGASAVNTAYTSALDAAALNAQAGNTVTVRISGTSADNIRLWSRESTAAAYRPALVLEFTPVG